jgi:hypothetical protein
MKPFNREIGKLMLCLLALLAIFEPLVFAQDHTNTPDSRFEKHMAGYAKNGGGEQGSIRRMTLIVVLWAEELS